MSEYQAIVAKRNGAGGRRLLEIRALARGRNAWPWRSGSDRAPNTSLHRTPAALPPSPVSSQSLGNGSILPRAGTKRQHGRRSVLGVLVLLLLATSGAAQDSKQQNVGPYLFAEFPCQTNAPPCYLPVIPAGAPLRLVVYATPGNFTGTVAFTSSNPLATLPSPYTFTTTDQGLAGFTIFLRSLGPQSVTVSDTSGAYAPGTASITVARQRRVRVVPFRSPSVSGS